jgi:hypothetical protein
MPSRRLRFARRRVRVGRNRTTLRAAFGRGAEVVAAVRAGDAGFARRSTQVSADGRKEPLCWEDQRKQQNSENRNVGDARPPSRFQVLEGPVGMNGPNDHPAIHSERAPRAAGTPDEVEVSCNHAGDHQKADGQRDDREDSSNAAHRSSMIPRGDDLPPPREKSRLMPLRAGFSPTSRARRPCHLDRLPPCPPCLRGEIRIRSGGRATTPSGSGTWSC